jgi:hypothetical protein
MALITISVEGESVLGVIANLRNAADLLAKQASSEINIPPVTNVAIPTAAEPAVKKTKKTATAEAPATAPTPATAPPPAEVPATAAPAAPAVTFLQVADLIPKVVTKLGRPVGVALLAEFGAKRGGDIKENQYGPFVARAEALLNGTQTITLPA